MTYLQYVHCSCVQCKERIWQSWMCRVLSIRKRQTGKYCTNQEMCNLKVLIWMQIRRLSWGSPCMLIMFYSWVQHPIGWWIRPNQLPWQHLLSSAACALPWEIWPWLGKSWWFQWEFAGSLSVQTLLLEQRLSGASCQKWTLLHSNSHSKSRPQGACMTLYDWHRVCGLGVPWQWSELQLKSSDGRFVLLSPCCLAKS